jgi:hypothetical protein
MIERYQRDGYFRKDLRTTEDVSMSGEDNSSLEDLRRTMVVRGTIL